MQLRAFESQVSLNPNVLANSSLNVVCTEIAIKQELLELVIHKL